MSKNLNNNKTDDYWTYVSDVMIGLTIIFLFIAINYIKIAGDLAESAKDIVIDYEKIKTEIESKIKEEFSDDFENWDASFNPQTLSFKFNSSEVLFDKGIYELSENFKKILDDFFPRYIFIIKNEQFIDKITAIQIEGHTSSDWGEGKQRGLEAYINNMKLSQKRSSNVLKHILGIEIEGVSIGENDYWTRNKITSVGYSSSRLIFNKQNQFRVEDELASRRVSFRLITDSESKLNEVNNISLNQN